VQTRPPNSNRHNRWFLHSTIVQMRESRRTNENLVATNATLTKAIADIQLSIARMCAAGVLTSHPPAPLAEAHVCPSHWSNTKPAWDKVGYCWTHGYKVKVGHNSSSCLMCKTGHQPSATRANIMGGSTYNTRPGTPPPPHLPPDGAHQRTFILSQQIVLLTLL
jgi:hypothetical protein